MNHRSRLLLALAINVAPAGMPARAADAGLLPTGGTVKQGSASIAQSGTAMTVLQTTQRAVIDWSSFDIGSAARVDVLQPGSNAVLLNRVIGGDPSRIFGTLNSNGQVFLVNPNGVLFGQGAQVNVGGLVASTLDIANADFMAGRLKFAGSTGTVGNAGSLKAADGGFVALLGGQVSNTGTITARRGTVALAAGTAMTLDFNGDGLLGVVVDGSAAQALAANGGLIVADGGQVLMTAKAADALAATVVNNTGVIEARALSDRGGRIVLDGGDVGVTRAAGTLDASSSQGRGGSVIVTGRRVLVDDGALLDARSAAGGGEVLVGGGYQGGQAADGSSVRPAQSTTVMAGATLDASAIADGNGGTVAVWSDIADSASTTRVAGTLLARGGAAGGDGGRIETSGHWLDTAGVQGGAGAVAPAGKAGSWLFDPTDVTISSAGATLTGSVAGQSTVSSTTLSTLLASTDVTITTKSSGSNNGDITISSAITKASGGAATTLTLAADRNIYVNNTISGSSGAPLNVVLAARFQGGASGGVGLTASVLSYGGNITVGGGDINASGYAIANDAVLGYMYDTHNAAPGYNTKSAGIGLRGTSSSYALSVFLDASQNATSQSTTSVPRSNALTDTQVSNLATTLGAQSGGGNVTLRGMGDSTYNHNGSASGHASSWTGSQGVWLSPGGIFTSGNGNISVTGVGGYDSSGFYGVGGAGVLLENPNNYNSYVAGGNGFVSITGTGGKSSSGTNSWDYHGVVYNAYLISNNAFGVSGTDLLIRAGTAYVYSQNSSDFNAPVVGKGSGDSAGTPYLYLAGPSTASVTFHGDASAVTTSETGRTDGRIIAPNGAPQLYSADTTAAQAYYTFGGTGSGSTGTVPVYPTSSGGGTPTTTTVTHPTPLTVTLTGAETYNGAPVYTYAVSGTLQAGDDIQTILSGTPACTATCINASSTPYSLTQGSIVVAPTYGSRYSLAGVSGTLTIGQASLSVTGTRVYDGSTGFAASGLTARGVGGESFSLSGSGTLASRNVQSAQALGSVVGLTATALNGASGSNYLALSTGNTSVSITPKNVTLTAPVVGKTYDGGLAYTASVGDLSALSAQLGVVGDTVGAITLAYGNANVGAGRSVTASAAMVADGNAGANYSIGYLGNSASSITARPVSLSGNKVYDGSTAIAASAVTLSGVVTGETLTLTGSGSVASRNVASNAALTPGSLALGNGSGVASNYTLAGGSDTASITARPVTLTAPVISKTYDGSTAYTASASQLLALSGQLGVVGDTVTAIALTYGNANAGAGNRSVAAGGATVADGNAGANYSVSYLGNATSTIVPKALTATATAPNKVYDGGTAATPTLTITSGLVGSETLGVTGTASFNSRNVATANLVTVGSVSLSNGSNGGLASNYSLAPGQTASAFITPAPLSATITASDRIYDRGTAAATQGTLVGVLGSDAVALTTSGTFATAAAGVGKTVNTGASISGADATNYALSSNPTTTATINPLGVVGAITAADKTYDGTTVATTSGTLGGVLAGDAVRFVTSGTFGTRAAGVGKTVDVSGAIVGADAGNYTLSDNATTVATIHPLAITGAITAAGKTYDGTTAAATSGALNGVLNGDVVGFATSGSFATRSAGTDKTVNVRGAISGGDAGNYTLISNSTATATIDPLSITGAITAADKAYDGTTSATTAGSLTGVLGGDVVNFVTGGSFATRNAATGKTVNVSGSLGGVDAGNYVLTNNATTTATISPLTITGIVVAANKTYDGTTTALTAGSLSGVIVGDRVALLTSGTFADRNAGDGKTVNVNSLLVGADAANYLLGANATTLADIARAPIIAVTGITAAGKTYDGTTAATLDKASAGFAGRFGNDVLTVAAANGAFADKDAAPAKTVAIGGIVLGGADAANYTLLDRSSSATADIAKAPLTVKTNDASKVADGQAFSGGNGVTYSGFVAGETAAVLDGTLAWSGSAQGAVLPGNYVLSAGGQTAANYQMTWVDGRLTLAAPPTVANPPAAPVVADPPVAPIVAATSTAPSGPLVAPLVAPFFAQFPDVVPRIPDPSPASTPSGPVATLAGAHADGGVDGAASASRCQGDGHELMSRPDGKLVLCVIDAVARSAGR